MVTLIKFYLNIYKLQVKLVKQKVCSKECDRIRQRVLLAFIQ